MIDESFREDEILGKAYDARLMVRILRYLRPYAGLLAQSASGGCAFRADRSSGLRSPERW